jgi:hypothetical protein
MQTTPIPRNTTGFQARRNVIGKLLESIDSTARDNAKTRVKEDPRETFNVPRALRPGQGDDDRGRAVSFWDVGCGAKNEAPAEPV